MTVHARLAILVSLLVLFAGGCTQNGAWDLFSLLASEAREDIEDIDVLDSLLVRYTFDSVISPQNDDSGNGHDGSIVGAIRVTDGVRGGVLQFNGVSDYMEVPSISGGAPDFTISLWFNIASLPSVMWAVYAVDQWSPRGFHFNLRTSGALEAGVESNVPVAVPSNHTFSGGDIGQWIHVAVVYSSSGMITNIYIDGTLDNTMNHTTVYDAKLTYAWLGGYSGAARWFDGRMDDVRIYSRALTDAEIETVYQATK